MAFVKLRQVDVCHWYQVKDCNYCCNVYRTEFLRFEALRKGVLCLSVFGHACFASLKYPIKTQKFLPCIFTLLIHKMASQM